MACLPSLRARAPIFAAMLLFTACSGKDDASEGGADGGDSTGGGADSTSTTFGTASGGSATSASTSTTGASTTMGSGPADTGGSGSDGGMFIVPPDGGVAGMCSPELQDCAEGEKCTSYVSTPGGRVVDALKCVPSMGNKQFGDECTRMADNDDCAPGFFCMTDVSGHIGMGICLEYCDPNMPDTTCENGGTCFGFNDGALPLCENECDPLAPDCPQGQGCYLALNLFVCATTADPGGADGDTCQVIQGCQPGLVCVTGPAGCMDQCCTNVCDVSMGAGQCNGMGEECVAAIDNPPPGLENAGICVVPM